MKKRMFLAAAMAVMFVFTSVILTGCSGGSNDIDKESSVSQVFHVIDTKDLNGGRFDADNYSKYKVTMINTWATWCSACVSEMPDIGKLAKYYSKNGNDVQIIGLLTQTNRATGILLKGITDSERTKAEKIISDTGADYTHILVSENLSSVLSSELNVFPTTFFVNSEGYLIGDPVQGSHSEDEWKSIIKEKLAAVE
ncbi:MAG: TlpA family protein disulfide reductase [Eubacteriaceae bacterium]|nr:TlpA family protein disulfide reductase [Eubacteriaceae bacterium]